MTDKYCVTMRTVIPLGDGRTQDLEAKDYVPQDVLDAYVRDAHTRWQEVTVSDQPDAGPGGTDGETSVADHLKEK